MREALIASKDYLPVTFVLAKAINEKGGIVKEHPLSAEIVEAIKEWSGFHSPKNIFESEISECFTEAELVKEFGFGLSGELLTPEQAVWEVRSRCKIREEVFGWELRESELERNQ